MTTSCIHLATVTPLHKARAISQRFRDEVLYKSTLLLPLPAVTDRVAATYTMLSYSVLLHSNKIGQVETELVCVIVCIVSFAMT